VCQRRNDSSGFLRRKRNQRPSRVQTDEKGEKEEEEEERPSSSLLVRVGVEGVETDEELLTGSKDRWHFHRFPFYSYTPSAFSLAIFFSIWSSSTSAVEI
jgi:hypothetical protein